MRSRRGGAARAAAPPRLAASPRLACSQNEIYDIGTEILNLQCLNYSQNRLFCKSIIPEEIKSPGPVLQFGSVRIRFKAFWDVFFRKKSAAQDFYYSLAVPKFDLKPSGTFFSNICMRRWIRRLRVSMDFCRPSYEA